MPTDEPTQEPDEEPDAQREPPPTGEQERTDQGMAPIVTNTGGDDDDGAPTG